MDSEFDADPSIEPPPVVWETITPVQSHLHYWMRSADRRFFKSIDPILKQIGIIASEWAALRELYRLRRCMSPIEIGSALGMSKGGGSKLVSRLEAKELVEKQTPGFDRRFRSVVLTRQGRELVVSLLPIEKGADREFFGALGNGRRFRLREWMKHLLDPTRKLQMDRWVTTQLKQTTFQRVHRDTRAREAAERQAKADALWAYIQNVAHNAAMGIKGATIPCPIELSGE